jgi:predicted nucleic acid-binding protein
MTLVDTSVLVQLERRNLQALELVEGLLASGELAVSTVTAHELLRSPLLPDAWRLFWLEFLGEVVLADLDLGAAGAAAAIWADHRRSAPGAKLDVADVLIAGTARAIGADVITDDDAFAEILGAKLVRPS